MKFASYLGRDFEAISVPGSCGAYSLEEQPPTVRRMDPCSVYRLWKILFPLAERPTVTSLFPLSVFFPPLKDLQD